MKPVGRRSLSFAILFLLGVDAIAATRTTVSGEVVETYCWVVHGVGGTGHAQCGIDCAKRGLPVALYDAKSRGAYILMPPRDKTALPPDLVNAMGHRVQVKGEVLSRGGIQFLIVHSWQRAGKR